MIRTIIILITVLLCTSLSFAQKDKEIKVSFLKGKEQIENVQYYIIEGNDAYLLEKKNDKIILKSKYLKEDKKELKLLAKSGNKKVEFFINPEEIYYLKITKMPFSFKYLFKKMYVINQGFDYEEIVRQSKKKYSYKK